MVERLSVSSWDLFKPLVVTVFLPLVIGAAFRHYADTAATHIFPAVNVFAKVMALFMIVVCLVVYGRLMLDTAGSFALLAATIHVVGMIVITYRFGFGLTQGQRSVMALGNGTRNLAAIIMTAYAIPVVDPLVITHIVMWGLWSFVLAAIAARIFGKYAEKAVAGDTI